MLKYATFIITILAVLSETASSAEATEYRPKPKDNGWSLYIGGGTFIAPTYSGDDDYAVMAVPYVRVTNGDKFFASIQEGAGYALINQDGFKAGPLATIDFGRDENGSSPFRISGNESTDLSGLGNINATIALGGFAEYKLDKVKIKAKVGQSISSHKGLTGQIGVDYNTTVMGFGPPLIIAIGPRLKIADKNYLQAYYGITTLQATSSGLSQNEAKSGIYSYGIGGNLLMPLTQKSALSVFGSFDHLTGSAGQSSLVTERGHRDQFFGGISAAYKF